MAEKGVILTRATCGGEWKRKAQSHIREKDGKARGEWRANSGQKCMSAL